MNLDSMATVCSILGVSTLINYFVQRYFSKKDEASRNYIKKQNEEQTRREIERKLKEEKREQELKYLVEKVNVGLDTLRLLSYHRMSEEIERLLNKGFATPAERKILNEMENNYKQQGWNGDMTERLQKVYRLRADHPDK